MEKEELKELGLLVAIKEYCEKRIEASKEKIRSLTPEEIAKINESIFLTVTPKSYTKTTYTEEYKEELKKLKEEFPPIKETIENYSIELNATNYSNSKADIIIQNMFTQNKTTLKNMAASATKNTTK